MAQRAKDLSKKTKSSTTTNEVLIIQNTTNNKASQFPLDDVFPMLQDGGTTSGSKVLGSALATTVTTPLFVGGGFGSSITGSDKNTLIFKGVRSNTSILQFKNETLAGDQTRGNLVLDINLADLDLDDCDNSTSGFLSSVSLNNSNHVSGVLSVANGGLNAVSIDDKSVLVSQLSGTDTVRSLSMSTNGQLLIGGTSGPQVGTLTGGTNVTVTNSDGGIEISSSMAALTSNLRFSTYNLQTDGQWISGDGTDEGIAVNSAGKVFIGSSLPGDYYERDLNVQSGISLGNSTGSLAQVIEMKSTTSGASSSLTISGANADGTGLKGGDVTVEAGDGDTNGNGGDLTLKAGDAAGTGTDGALYLKTAGTNAVSVDANQDLTVLRGSLIVSSATEGFVHTNSQTVAQVTDWTTGVTINGSSGVITLESTTTLVAHGEAEFTVTNSAAQADSLIFLQMMNFTGAATQMIGCYVSNRADGAFDITVFNPRSSGGSTTAGDIRIAFFIVNNSV